MSAQALQRNAVWVYGVLVALAIEQALVKAVPIVLELEPSAITPSLAAGRLLLFLAATIAFFIGACNFFDTYHGPRSKSTASSFALDFPSGLVHFTLFVAWSITIPYGDVQFGVSISAYYLVMLFVFVFDLGWWLASNGLATAEQIWSWARRNTIGVVISLLLYGGVVLSGIDVSTAELTAFIPILATTAIDYRSLLLTTKKHARELSWDGPQVVIDQPIAASRVGQPFTVAGWALDMDAPVGTGVDTVHVWASPVKGGPKSFIGAAACGGLRPDVAAIYGARYADVGYGIIVSGLPTGVYDIAVHAWSTVLGDFAPAKVIRVTIWPPHDSEPIGRPALVRSLTTV